MFKRKQQRPWRRRNYFIKKGFQARFILKFLGVLMMGSAMSGYVMYLLINRDVEGTFYRSHIKLSSTGQLLLPTLLKVNFGVVALAILAVAVITLLITHKVAGPLLRLGREAERIGKGDLTGSFRLRTNDELKSLATSFEDMNRDMKERFNELKAHAEDIDRAAEYLMVKYAYSSLDGITGRDDQYADAQLDKLSQKAELFGKKLSMFELEKGPGI